MSRTPLVAALVGLVAFAQPAAAQTATGSGVGKSDDGKAIGFRVRTPARIDYANARPAPMPQRTAPPRSQAEMLAEPPSTPFLGPPKLTPGGEGDGRENPVSLPLANSLSQDESRDDAQDEPPAPPEFGSSGQPYTTTLENLASADPHRRAGKLFIQAGGETFVCSASLIDRGLIVTAAHCVAEFGQRRFFDNWQFVPGYKKGQAPYGTWDVSEAYVPNSYYSGAASCSTYGVTCTNDVAILVAKPKRGDYPGQRVGWFGYGTNGFGFNAQGQALITQLGYPTELNRGEAMIRTDSQGGLDRTLSNNTIIGSLQTGGSSGGPWIINFGDAAALSGGLKAGRQASRNVVVGVTSWGFVGPGAKVKQQGASPFTSSSLMVLVKDACKAFPRACS